MIRKDTGAALQAFVHHREVAANVFKEFISGHSFPEYIGLQ